ncbi:SDR family oxidoreductase [Nostoc ellipsosporum NOK]|nr:SDR family oxidoreductase [Nostoc ellipsosporum NOK]
MQNSRIAVITGASRGIGKAIAEKLAANGFDLLLVSRNEFKLYQALEDLMTRYPDVSLKARAFDLSEPAAAKACGEWILTHTTAPAVLVNNAGTYLPGDIYKQEEGVLESQLATNLYSAYHLTRALLPAMTAQKNGHIFNICSIASLRAYPNGGAYSISKFALYGFSQNLREEMKQYGIKVTAVLPGAVMTDSWQGFDNSQRRIMEASDIASLVYAATQLSPQACVEDIIIRPQLGDL